MVNPFEELLAELQATRKLQEEIKALLIASSISQALPPEIIDTKELINRLNITEPTIIRMRKKQMLPFMQIGSSVRYDWHAVVKALETKKGKGIKKPA